MPIKKVMVFIEAKLISRLRSTVGRNVIWMILGLGLRTGLQMAYFVLLARMLKPETYGLFAGIQALIIIFSPFSIWGSGNILVKNISRDFNSFSFQWGSTLTTTLIMGTFFTIVVFITSLIIYGVNISFKITLPLAFGDLLGMSLLAISALAFQAFERLSWTSILWVALSFNRLLMVLAMLFLPISRSLENWALLYCASGVISGGISLIFVRRELGWGKLTLAGLKNEWKQGFYFSLDAFAQGTYNDIDKILLSRLSEAISAGAYAAAYRILDVFLIPVKSLFFAFYPLFFKVGETGVRGTYHLAKRLFPWTIVWGIMAWIALSVGSFIFPMVLGKEYELVSIIIVFLGPILFFRSFHYLAADSLTGAGLQGLRSAIQVGIALFNLWINLWLIPLLGWKGAVISSLASDGLLAVILWGILIIKAKKVRSISESN